MIIQSLTPLRFTDPLGSIRLETYGEWRVCIDGISYHVPDMMPFEVSIPRLFWRACDPPLATLARPGAVLHDAAYKGLLTPSVMREQADWLFYELMRWNGLDRVRAWAMFRAVRILGGRAWKREHERYRNWVHK